MKTQQIPMEHEDSKIKTYITRDYNLFKKLIGNRSVADNRVNAIIDSIRSIGYQPVPIYVNEKMEVIDGQGRLEACRRLSLPIYYQIGIGVGINECRAMNIKMKNWDIYDFIQSYADQRNKNYERLMNYYDNESSINLIEVAMCMSDTAWSKNVNKQLRDGKFEITESDENIGALEMIKSVAPYLDKLRGGHQQYIPILVGLYKFDLINDLQMVEQIRQHIGTMQPAYNAETALDELQKVYNYHRRKNERFRDKYLTKMEEKGARYKL